MTIAREISKEWHPKKMVIYLHLKYMLIQIKNIGGFVIEDMSGKQHQTIGLLVRDVQNVKKDLKYHFQNFVYIII